MKERKKIRTIIDGGTTWFNVSDMFEVIGKSWRGKPDLYKKGIEKQDLREVKIKNGKSSKPLVYIRDRSFYKLLIHEADYDSKVSEIVSGMLFNKKDLIRKLII